MNRRALAIGVAAFLAFALLWYFALWSPRSKALSAAKDRRVAAEEQQTQLQASIARLKAAAKDEPRLRAQLETLRTSIPDDPNLAQFILDTNDAATKAGIDFVSISPTVPAAPSPTTGPAAAPTTTTTVPAAGGGPAPTVAQAPPQVAIQMQVTGGYFQMLDFINRVTDLPRLVVVDSVNLTADQGGKLTAGIAARMFVRSVPAAFAPPGTLGVGASTTTVAGSATTTPAGVRQ